MAANFPTPGCERGGAWLRVRAPTAPADRVGAALGPTTVTRPRPPSARPAPRCPLAHLLRVRVRGQPRLQLLHNLERRLRRHRCHWRGLLAGTGLASRPRAAAPPSVHPRRRRKRYWPLPGLGGLGGAGAGTRAAAGPAPRPGGPVPERAPRPRAPRAGSAPAAPAARPRPSAWGARAWTPSPAPPRGEPGADPGSLNPDPHLRGGGLGHAPANTCQPFPAGRPPGESRGLTIATTLG